jgi:hypothetical protein
VIYHAMSLSTVSVENNMINHCHIPITLPGDTDTVIRHSMIHHCDISITLSDTDTVLCLCLLYQYQQEE